MICFFRFFTVPGTLFLSWVEFLISAFSLSIYNTTTVQQSNLVTRYSTIMEILKIRSKNFSNKNPTNCILLHKFSLFSLNFDHFHNFFHIFNKKLNNSKKYSGHSTCRDLDLKTNARHVNEKKGEKL